MHHFKPPAPSLSLRRHPLAAGVAALFACGSATLCEAGQVTNCNDSGAGSLRAVVAAAADGDVIDMTALTCSTITLTSGGIGTSLDNLSILGPGATRLTVKGPQTPEAPFFANNNASGTFYLGYLTVANGHGVGPGCVYAKGNLSLRGVTVTGCTSLRNVGGGIRTRHNLTLVNSQLTGNTDGDSAGGGGAWVDGDANISNSTISNNVATSSYSSINVRGGGLAVLGNLRLTDSTISGNSISSSGNDARALGGGVYVVGDAYVSHSVISGNSASGAGAYAQGGGIFVGTGAGPTNYAYFGYSSLSANTVRSSTTGTIAQVQGGSVFSSKSFGFKFSTIDHNHSSSRGGGIAAGTAAHLNLVMSTVSGNLADLDGGAVFTRYGRTMLLLNSTVGLNFVGSTGCAGILFYNGGTLTAESSIIAKNTKYNSSAIPCDIKSDAALTISATNGHNLIQNSSAPVPPDTLSADPQFFTLADNGGFTRTLGIQSTSPARQTGSNLFNLAWDQRGPGYARTFSGKTDIGAFEWQGPGDGDTIFTNGFD